MKDLALLDNITHKDLKVQTHYSQAFGDNIASTLTFPTELVNVVKHYPVLLRKQADSGKFQMIVLLGLARNENLFLAETSPFQHDQGSWLADYVPALIAKGPFVIGMHTTENNPQPMVHVDMANPRISTHKGKPVFLPHGGNSDYLNYISSLLKTIHDGMQVHDTMLAVLDSHGLIEPVSIDVPLTTGETIHIADHYTVSKEKLSALPADALFELHQRGFLQAAFLIEMSLSNMRKLIDLKNTRLMASAS